VPAHPAHMITKEETTSSENLKLDTIIEYTIPLLETPKMKNKRQF